MSKTTKHVQLYDLARSKVIAEMPYFGDVNFLEGDELEMPDLGAFKIVKRRWALSGESVILVLILEPLA